MQRTETLMACTGWVLIIALTCYAWYLLLQNFNLYALILCLYLTLGIIKSFLFLFQYAQMRKFVISVMSEEIIILKIFGVLGLAVGAGLILLGCMI